MKKTRKPLTTQLLPLWVTPIVLALMGCGAGGLKMVERNELVASGSVSWNKSEVKRIAVIPAAKQAIADIDYNAVIDENFTKNLLNKGYTVVDRETLELVLREQQLTAGPAFNDADAPRIGKLLTASHVAIVRLPYFVRTGTGYYQTRVQAKIVNVETGQVLGTVEAENRIKKVVGVELVEFVKELQSFLNPVDAFGNVCRSAADQIK